jgi:hypothetical protein
VQPGGPDDGRCFAEQKILLGRIKLPGCTIARAAQTDQAGKETTDQPITPFADHCIEPPR